MTNAVNVAALGSSPAFSVYGSASQTGLSSGSTVKAALNTKVYDTASFYDTSTYRFTPTVAGYYQINMSAYVQGNLTQVQLNLNKNGSQYTGQFYMAISMPSGVVATGSTLVYLNGSTDYIEMYVYAATSSGTFTISSSSQNTFFNGCLMRGA